MSNKYKFLAIFSLLLSCGTVAEAQTYCLKYEVIKNTTTVDVRVGLVAEGSAFKLGAGNLQLIYNGTGLSSPMLLSNVLTSKGYKSVAVTQPVSPNLKGTNDKLISLNFDFRGQTGEGLSISESGTNIGVIRFQKGKPSLPFNLRAYNNSTIGTIIYNDDNTNPQLLTSLKNCPISDIEMPSRWLNISAKQEASQAVTVDWSLVSDENTSHFIVERSADNRNFEPIGQVKANAKLNDYVFTDSKPLKSAAYYRVQQINFDQTESLSDTKKIVFDKRTSLKVYPTVLTNASNILTIDLPASSNGKPQDYQIINASGQIVSTGKITERVEVEVGSFPAGIYLLKVGGENVKLVKQ